MPPRSVARVESKQRFGPDAQVDDKALLIRPSEPSRTDPFLLLAEDWFSSPGFEWHPHRGLETVTFVLDGVLEHGDSLGNAGALQVGDAQWMTAGRGIVHRELAFRDNHAHTLQLWLNLPSDKRMVETRYQDVRVTDRPRVERPGVVVDVISGHVAGASGPAANHWPINGAIITIEPSTTFRLDVPGDHRAFLSVLDGEVTIDGRHVREGETAWSDPVGGGMSHLDLVTGDVDAPTRVMAYSGRPIREPIVMGGPFVMNSRQQIEQAHHDFHAGKFGKVPRQSRLRQL
jgi:redox-sensitive bicupin YhaK (pirin superfamily)